MVLSDITSQTPQRSVSGFQWTSTSLRAICTLKLSAAYLHNVFGKISEVTHNQTNMASLLLSQMEKDSYYKELAKIKIQFLQRCMNLIFNFPKSKKFKSQVAVYLANAKLVTVQSFLEFARSHSSRSQSRGLPT